MAAHEPDFLNMGFCEPTVGGCLHSGSTGPVEVTTFDAVADWELGSSEMEAVSWNLEHDENVGKFSEEKSIPVIQSQSV